MRRSRRFTAAPWSGPWKPPSPWPRPSGCRCSPRAGLQEIDFGSWQGKTMKQMARMKLWKVVQQAPSQMRFPGGESFAEAQQRMVAELEDIAAGPRARRSDRLLLAQRRDQAGGRALPGHAPGQFPAPGGQHLRAVHRPPPERRLPPRQPYQPGPALRDPPPGREEEGAQTRGPTNQQMSK